MVLVDTSVWLRALYGQKPYLPELDELLARKVVAGHEFVYDELLIGDRSGRKKVLADYMLMRQAKRIAHEEVVALVRHRKLNGRGVSCIDVHLLASAMAEQMQLWTADQALAEMARELGVGYK